MATIASLIVRVAADTAELKENMEKAEGFIKKAAVAFAAAWVVDKIKDAAMAAIELGGRMEDLAARTGMGTQALQEFSYAGKLVGVSLDSVVSATGLLQKNLGIGGDSVVGALGMLQLKLEDIKGMRPEDQFTTIAAKLKDIKNQSDFARIGTELMGRGFLEVAPLIRTSLQEVTDEAHRLGVILSEEDLKALDGLGDAMDKVTMAGEAALARALIPMTPALTDLAGSIKFLPDVIDAVVLAFDSFVWAGAKVVKIAAEIGIAGLQIQKFTDPWKNISGDLDKGITELRTLAEMANEVVKATVEVDRSAKGAAASTREHAAVIPSLVFNYGAAATAADALTAANERNAKAMHDLYFDMQQFGSKAIKEMTATVQTEMARQRDAVAAAQMEIVRLLGINKQKDRAAAEGTGVDAQIAALNRQREADLANAEQLGRAAGDLGSAAYADYVQQLQNRIETDFQVAFNDLVSGAAAAMNGVGATVTAAGPGIAAAARTTARGLQGEFVTAFQSVANEADVMAARVAAIMNLMEQNKKNFGMFGGNFGTADAINRMAARNAGLTIPTFAAGGAGDFGSGTLAMLHGRERIVPLDGNGGGGGATVIVNVSANNSFYDTPDGVTRLGDIVGAAVVAKLAGMGARL